MESPRPLSTNIGKPEILRDPLVPEGRISAVKDPDEFCSASVGLAHQAPCGSALLQELEELEGFRTAPQWQVLLLGRWATKYHEYSKLSHAKNCPGEKIARVSLGALLYWALPCTPLRSLSTRSISVALETHSTAPSRQPPSIWHLGLPFHWRRPTVALLSRFPRDYWTPPMYVYMIPLLSSHDLPQLRVEYSSRAQTLKGPLSNTNRLFKPFEHIPHQNAKSRA